MEIERAERNFNAERGFGFIEPDDSGKGRVRPSLR
jgi:hypothetical protein